MRHAPRLGKKLIRHYVPKNFYESNDWKRLRYKTIAKFGGKCQACGNRGEIHVDHIKPIATHPHMAYDEDNLQILCKDCNIGKSFLSSEDWR